MKKTLNTCSWSEIAEMAKNGKAKELFNLGDTKTDYMKNGDSIEYRIIGFNHDLENSITFEAITTYRVIEFSDKICTYKESKAYKYLHNEFLDLVSDDLKENIKEVEKINLYRNFSSISKNYFFILSEQEVFGRRFYSCGKEGKWYDYYKQEDVNYGFDRCRWLRSRFYSDKNLNGMCGINPTGIVGGSYQGNFFGFAPAFCI